MASGLFGNEQSGLLTPRKFASKVQSPITRISPVPLNS